jgi:hypothetical protein
MYRRGPSTGYRYFPAKEDVLIIDPAVDTALRAAPGRGRSAPATDEEIDQHLGNVAAGILDLATSPMISAWGRKPG